MLNYHELTMEESANSPARRKQFVIICSVMVGAIVYTVLSTGCFESINIYEGVFPEGEFVYKFTKRDYAASMSLVQSVASDLSIRRNDFEDVMYSVFLDDPNKVFGRQQRFAAGILLRATSKDGKDVAVSPEDSSTTSEKEDRKALLFGLNEQKQRKVTQKEINDLAADDLWPKLDYEAQDLPAAKVAVVQFPFSNGFVSPLLHSHRVFPALRKYAMEKMKTDLIPAIVSTCSIKHSMCTHFVPLEQVETFRLGRVDTGSYLGQQKDMGLVDWDGVKSMLTTIFTLGQGGGWKKSPEKGKEEL